MWCAVVSPVVVHTAHDWLTLARPRASEAARRHQVLSSTVASQPARGARPECVQARDVGTRVPGKRVFLLSREGRRVEDVPTVAAIVVRNLMPALLSGPCEQPRRRRLADRPQCRSPDPGQGGAELVRALPHVQAEAPCRLRSSAPVPESRLRALAVELVWRRLLSYPATSRKAISPTHSTERRFRVADVAQ
jgi:hypothetical protein